MATRHLIRTVILQTLYEWDFYRTYFKGGPAASREDFPGERRDIPTTDASASRGGNRGLRPEKTPRAADSAPSATFEIGSVHEKDVTEILERNLQEFAPGIDEPEFAWKILKGVADHFAEIDGILKQAAPEWPLDKIAIIDRNILRIGLYELLFADHNEVPPKVAINEAIELAKNFGGPNTARFVNGVLGTIYCQVEAGAAGKEEKKA
jgi:N utilization substance protein B